MTKKDSDELRRCDGCYADRVCREYRELWFCVRGPGKCWRKRQNLWAKRNDS